MRKVFLRGGVVLSLLTALALFAGCSGKGDDKVHKDDDHKDHKDDDHKHGKKDEGDEGHVSTDGWWCNGHGLPEEECSMCSAKVEKEAKAKGDWCEMHNRAKSQCFICDPKLKEKYAARYRARYGKEPPLTDEEKEAKKKQEKKDK